MSTEATRTAPTSGIPAGLLVDGTNILAIHSFGQFKLAAGFYKLKVTLIEP